VFLAAFSIHFKVRPFNFSKVAPRNHKLGTSTNYATHVLTHAHTLVLKVLNTRSRDTRVQVGYMCAQVKTHGGKARQRRGCVAQGEASALYKSSSTPVLVQSRHTTHNTRHTTHDTRHTTHDTRHMTSARAHTTSARAHSANTFSSLDDQMRALLRNIARLNM